jgi:hypothetical protein
VTRCGIDPRKGRHGGDDSYTEISGAAGMKAYRTGMMSK